MAEVNTRKRGSKWEFYFEAAKIGGCRKRITKGGFPTKKEALTAGTKALAEYNSAGLHFTPSEISFSDYLDYWYQEYCLVNLQQSTITSYEKKIRLHLKPALGQYKLKALTPSVLQSFINKLFNDGISRNSLLSFKAVLSNSLNYAVEPLKYIQVNPMQNVKLPSTRAVPKTPTRSAPHVYITPDKIHSIFERFPEGTSTHIPLQLGYKCGMRIGEAYAITWENVDFENKLITIEKQIQWHEDKKVWYISTPKYDSIRIIEIDDSLISLLKREKDRQDKARNYYAEYYTQLYVNKENEINTIGNGTILPLVSVRENGELIHPRTMQHTSQVIHHKLGYKDFTFHSLRHTHASMLAEKNAPPKYVQHRLGHKNVQVTMQIYQHLTEPISKQGASILKDLF